MNSASLVVRLKQSVVISDVLSMVPSVQRALKSESGLNSASSYSPAGFSGPAALRLSAFGAKVMAAMAYK
jgi:hypothetical protein